MDGKGAFPIRTSLSSSGYTNTDSSSFRYEDSSMYTTSTKTSTRTSTRTSTSITKIPLYANHNFYGYSEICAATNNFLLKPLSSSKRAWRCSIRRKDVVVIKRKLGRNVDMPEIVDTLSTIWKSYHNNIIKLLGASISGNRIFLVYDYASGVNLADSLRNPKDPNLTVLSTWISRMRIATEIAHGLEHIHHYVESETSVVHNQLKSTSIIVSGPDPYFSAKICHFGTAELSEESGIEGRRCYMAPELIDGGMASQKSDVFALGVLLLEILSGEEPVKEIYDEESRDYRKISLIDSARDAIESGDVTKMRRWIDKRLGDSYPDELAEKMMHVGLDCVREEPNKRPNMHCVATKIWKLYLDFGGNLYI